MKDWLGRKVVGIHREARWVGIASQILARAVEEVVLSLAWKSLRTVQACLEVLSSFKYTFH
jgi:hypothetical protein